VHDRSARSVGSLLISRPGLNAANQPSAHEMGPLYSARRANVLLSYPADRVRMGHAVGESHVERKGHPSVEAKSSNWGNIRAAEGRIAELRAAHRGERSMDTA
jgi:hypothetical protein